MTDLALIHTEVQQKIDHWLTKYPPEQRQSALLPALLLVQEQNGGWLTVPLMDALAAYLGIAKAAVYECASFYSMYEHEPVGKTKLSVCTNISCLLRGSEEIVAHLEHRLGIRMGETTSDGKFTLREVECMAACGGAPMLQVNDQEYHENLTLAKVDAILAQTAESNHAA